MYLFAHVLDNVFQRQALPLSLVQVQRGLQNEFLQAGAAEDLLLHLVEPFLHLRVDHTGDEVLGICCGVIRMTACEIYVSGHMNATTTDNTKPTNIGPMIHDRSGAPYRYNLRYPAGAA